MPAPLRRVLLGRRPYGFVHQMQLNLVARRQRDEIPDTVLIVEHEHVITLGRRQEAMKNVLAAGDIPVLEIERGGDVTYHGPGQLVGYPILKLAGEERDLHAYLRNIEQALLDTLAHFGIEGGRNPGWTGAWVGDKKIASIGIAVRKWVTFHGFALNVRTDLKRFAAINPCGLKAEVMTSMAEVLGRDVDLEEVAPVVCRALADVFGRALVKA